MSAEEHVWSLAGTPLRVVSIGPVPMARLDVDLTGQLDERLGGYGLDRSAIVRTRLVAGSADARVAGSDWRARALVGPARASSSSYVDRVRCRSENAVRLEFVCLATPDGSEKRVVEHEPPKRPPRWVQVGSLVFVSGNTSVAPGLRDQLAEIDHAVRDAITGAGLPSVFEGQVRCYLHRSIAPRELLELLPALLAEVPGGPTVWAVDGFSSPKKLVEVEVTATAPNS